MAFSAASRAVSPAAGSVALRAARGLRVPAHARPGIHAPPRSLRRVHRRAASDEIIDVTAEPVPESDDDNEAPAAVEEEPLAMVCPICQITKFPIGSTDLTCNRCSRTFSSSAEFTDLTLTSGVEYKSYKKQWWGGTTTFQSPLVSYVYERGWRQGFSWAGFPGADTEFDLAMGYLKPAFGEVLIDMSCGSGLFTRKFAKSGKFQHIVAADFSENMLKQTRSFIREDSSIDASTVSLLRADIGRLPFASGTVSAIHAGAAIHCWPDPQQAMAEISRVLKPGGVFVASTFLNFYAPLGQIVGDDPLRPLKDFEPFGGSSSSNLPYKFWEEQELRDLCQAVGLSEFQRERDQRFIMFTVSKPKLPGQ